MPNEKDLLALRNQGDAKIIDRRAMHSSGRDKPREKLEFHRQEVLPDHIQDSAKEHLQVLLHPFTHEFENFHGEHGQWKGDNAKVVIHLFEVKMDPDATQNLLEFIFQNRAHPPAISYEPEVIVGDRRRPGKLSHGSHTLLWQEDLSDNMLKWIKEKLILFDEKLGERK